MFVSVRYKSEPGVFAWPVPFAYGKAADVGVTLADAAGQERRLKLDTDYILQNGNVICMVPAGCALTIFLDAPEDQSLAANSSRIATLSASMAQSITREAAQPQVVAAQPQALAAQPQAIAASADNPVELAQAKARIEELERKLDALLAQAASDKDYALESLRAREHDERLAQIDAASSGALASIDEKLEAQQQAALANVQASCQSSLKRIADAGSSLDAAAQKAMAAAQEAELAGQVALDVRDSLDTTREELAADAQELVAASCRNMASASRTGLNSIEQARATALAEIREASQAAASACACQIAAAGQAWPQAGSFTISETLPAGALLVLPRGMYYYPGRNSLFIAVNGYVLTLGVDYEETGSQPDLSNTLRLLRSTLAGDVWSFCVLPVNIGQTALAAAKEAKDAAQEAQHACVSASLFEADTRQLAANMDSLARENLAAIHKDGQEAVDRIAALRQTAKAELRDLRTTNVSEATRIWQQTSAEIRKLTEDSTDKATRLWQEAERGIGNARQDLLNQAQAASNKVAANKEAAAQSQKRSLELARSAWHAAFNASVSNARPGMASVCALDELVTVPSGVYVINPNVIYRSPILGVWPVASVADMKWDGFFFIGIPWPLTPQPEPPESIGPYPEDPAQTPGMEPIAQGKDWLPCDHHHN